MWALCCCQLKWYAKGTAHGTAPELTSTNLTTRDILFQTSKTTTPKLSRDMTKLHKWPLLLSAVVARQQKVHKEQLTSSSGTNSS